MAKIGTGSRTVADLLIEVSYQLVEPFVDTALTAAVTVGAQTVPVGSTDSMYVGAQVVVDVGTPREAVTITAVGSGTFTAVFANAHASGTSVIGATFPAQQATDPLYTQAEMLGYLSRAQNEFLAKVPVIYALFQQQATYGQIFQNTPDTAIEIQRIAASSVYIAVTSATRSGNVVTVVTTNPHGLKAGSTPFLNGALDETFDGNSKILTTPTPTTLTYSQDGPNAATTGGAFVYWLRLYEFTQEELSQQYRQWRNAYIQSPAAWFEDRTGLYRFGLNGKPSSNFPLELLCSIRDDDSLGLADSFLVPDIFLHLVKYILLMYVMSKNGVESDPIRLAYCTDRVNRGIMAAQRWVGGIMGGGDR